MDNEIKFIDLFAGIGGFKLVQGVGAKCVFSAEIDEHAKKNIAVR